MMGRMPCLSLKIFDKTVLGLTKSDSTYPISTPMYLTTLYQIHFQRQIL